jgi:3-deoxy-D-manno-octulosonic-acid transferase
VWQRQEIQELLHAKGGRLNPSDVKANARNGRESPHPDIVGKESRFMPYLLNVLYLLALIAASPWLAFKSMTTGKYRRGLWLKLTGRNLRRKGNQPCVWFHGVSVGEIHLLRRIVAAFRERHPDWDCVISTTTDTGLDEARRCYPDLPVFYWPLDFSWAVRAALGRVRPAVVVLAECELWPNFLAAAEKRGISVAVINGRMSPRSRQRFQRLGWLSRNLFQRLALCAVQTNEHAAAFGRLGAPYILVTGSVKYDGATLDRNNPHTCRLRELLSVGVDDLVWVAGSTQAPEEDIVLDIFHRARAVHPNLRLLLVPRHKERFDEVAGILCHRRLPFIRRSTLNAPGARHEIILVDTIGELGSLWGLADLAFVGGSLDGKRGGQNMIEPAAYGAAVVFGPHTWNFKDTVSRLLECRGAVQVRDADELARETFRLLSNPGERAALGGAARQFVRSQQGAVAKTLEALEILLKGPISKAA